MKQKGGRITGAVGLISSLFVFTLRAFFLFLPVYTQHNRDLEAMEKNGSYGSYHLNPPEQNGRFADRKKVDIVKSRQFI